MEWRAIGGNVRGPRCGRGARATLHDVRTLAAGGSCIQFAITERITRALESRRPTFESGLAMGQLSEREIEVLRLIAAGYSDREIADLLSISEGTAKNHASSILGKLGVRDRLRAVLKAIDMGLI